MVIVLLFQKNKFNLMREFQEHSFVDFVQTNVPGTFGEVGILLVDVSVQVGIIHFLQASIKMNCEKIS